MTARLRVWLHAVLIALDQLAFTLLRLPYVPTALGDPPSPYETISSFVGRQAQAGWLWARIAERFIDTGIFTTLVNSPPGHCRRSVIRTDWILAPLP